jgi:hypothetical protein
MLAGAVASVCYSMDERKRAESNVAAQTRRFCLSTARISMA